MSYCLLFRSRQLCHLLNIELYMYRLKLALALYQFFHFDIPIADHLFASDYNTVAESIHQSERKSEYIVILQFDILLQSGHSNNSTLMPAHMENLDSSSS